MKPITEYILKNVVTQFAFEGLFIGIVPYGNGHINNTFAAYFQKDSGDVCRYIVQRINSVVFRKPLQVMENVIGVTCYLRECIIREGGNPLRETLNLIPTADGTLYVCDEDGEYWRAYLFVENTITYQKAESVEEFYQSALAFGKFQMLLANYPADTLHETIPNFHDTPDRLRQFKEALETDKMGRAANVCEEIAFILERETYTHTLVDQLAAGKLPLRVTHNDTKLNNVLIDRDSKIGICIIDLDTVMPGLSLYDFGDSIRFGASTAEEDEQDLDKVHFDISLYECYVRGYLEAAGNVMTKAELASLRDGAKMMTLECGTRFLTDYLNGDVYFRVHREGHNLDRARTQFKLVAEIEQQWEAMKQIVDKFANREVTV